MNLKLKIILQPNADQAQALLLTSVHHPVVMARMDCLRGQADLMHRDGQCCITVIVDGPEPPGSNRTIGWAWISELSTSAADSKHEIS